jgi:hypothetical protein
MSSVPPDVEDAVGLKGRTCATRGSGILLLILRELPIQRNVSLASTHPLLACSQCGPPKTFPGPEAALTPKYRCSSLVGATVAGH